MKDLNAIYVSSYRSNYKKKDGSIGELLTINFIAHEQYLPSDPVKLVCVSALADEDSFDKVKKLKKDETIQVIYTRSNRGTKVEAVL